jgi:hypothetical protein
VTAARAIANRTADLRGRTCAAPRTAADADPVDLRCRDSRAHADVSDCPIISIRSVIFVLDDPRHTPGTEKTARIAENAQADVLSRYYQQVPLLLFCFLTPRREQTARHALAASPDSLSLRIATAAIDPRVTCPAGQVWMPLHSSGRQVRLIDLAGIPFEAVQSAYTADPYR